MNANANAGPRDTPSNSLGIAEVATRTGLTPDTLRWYEREGLLPRVARSADRRRRYEQRDVAMVDLVARLRESGMPVQDMREFATLVGGGAATHGQRLAVLARHRTRIMERREALDAALAALDAKAEHYRRLIAEGLDCDGNPVSDEVAVQQRQGLPA